MNLVKVIKLVMGEQNLINNYKNIENLMVNN